MRLPYQNPRSPRAEAVCPRCQSGGCASNRISNLSFGEAAGNLWVAHRDGRLIQGLQGFAAWSCVEAANALRNQWQCDYCRETFR